MAAGDEVLLDIAPNSKRSMWEATNMDNTFKLSSKLMAKANGPCKVVRGTPETVPTDQEGLENTLSLDRVVRRLRGARPSRELIENSQSGRPSPVGGETTNRMESTSAIEPIVAPSLREPLRLPPPTP